MGLWPFNKSSQCRSAHARLAALTFTPTRYLEASISCRMLTGCCVQAESGRRPDVASLLEVKAFLLLGKSLLFPLERSKLHLQDHGVSRSAVRFLWSKSVSMPPPEQHELRDHLWQLMPMTCSQRQTAASNMGLAGSKWVGAAGADLLESRLVFGRHMGSIEDQQASQSQIQHRSSRCCTCNFQSVVPPFTPCA